MDLHGSFEGFPKPAMMFNTLRRLHGHNLENQGLNDLSDSFTNFVTRAKFFSISRLRRTWSHSAVEFMNYRRLLPLLTVDNSGEVDQTKQGNCELPDSAISSCKVSPENSSILNDKVITNVPIATTKGEGKKIIITNVSPRVTSNQLTSFFSKFGKVSVCHIPLEDRRYSNYSTMPNRTLTDCKSKSSLTAFITFKRKDGADKAKSAGPEELMFYGLTMNVSSHVSTRRRTPSSAISKSSTIIHLRGHSDGGILSLTRPNSCGVQPLPHASTLYTQFSIKILPPRALEYIFYHLPLTDRIRLERVCKIFLESSIKSWGLNDSLCFSKLGNINYPFDRSNPLRKSVFKAILSRCGAHLKKLDISGVINVLDDAAFDLIASYCPNLSELNISGVRGHWRTMRSLGASLRNLKSLVCRNMANATDREFWHLFHVCGQNLLSVDLRGCRRIKGVCFRHFGEHLEKIFLDGCNGLENGSIDDLCLHSSNVKELRLSGCTLINNESLSLITRSITDLRCFALSGGRFDLLTENGLLTLARLQFLSELSLDFNPLVTNELVEALATSNSELKVLNIAHAGSGTKLTEESLVRLSLLRNLEKLDVSGLAGITDKVLTSIAEISTVSFLRCQCCAYLGNDGVSALVNLNRIEHIDLSGCILVTGKGVQKLIDAFRIDSNAKVPLQPLTLVIGGTVCNISELKLCGSRVVIDGSDYSVLSRTTARNMLHSSSRTRDLSAYPDDDFGNDSSNDEFEALNTHRSFIIDALQDEDDSPLGNKESINKWAENEARNLGLI